MIITQENLSIFRSAITVKFKDGLKSDPPMDENQFATVTTSTTGIEKYPMTAFMDDIKKWVGPRKVGSLSAKLLQVENEDYEVTIGVPKNDLEDDSYGIYNNIAEGKGRQCRALWGRLGVAALTANGNWLDGSAFFLTTRKYGKNTINNKTTSALSATTYGAARTAMMSYLGFDGAPLGVTPNVLVVGPALETTARKIVDNDKIVESHAGDTDDATVLNHVAGPNPYHKTATVVVSPYLVGDHANKWYLMDTTKVVKPVLIQKRKEGPLVALDKETDPNVFTGSVDGKEAVPGGVIVYGAHYRGAAALALPHCCYGGIVAA